MSYVLYAEIPLKPDAFEAATDAVRSILPATRGEAGCELFALHVAADGSPRLLIFERWRDRAAYDFHHAQSYTKAVFKSYEDWLAGPVTITELSEVEAAV